MELFLLDKDFQICGLIDDFSSLVWNRKYYECGNFNLQINIKYLNKFKDAVYISSKDFTETAVIENLNYKTTIQGTEIQISGRFLESKLAQRVIDNTQIFKDMISEDIIRNLVNTFIINSGDRKIPNLVLGKRKAIGKKHTIQITGDNLLDKIYELCKEDELSIQIRYDLNNNQMIFEVWQGLNRKDTQDLNSWAIFSRSFENILEDEYSIDNTKYCNFAYVVGEDNGKETVVTINRVKDGEERRELYVEAKDLQKDGELTDEEYKQMLIEKGIEKLNECNKVETANFNVNLLSNLEYQRDFDLGDEVVYKNDKLNFNIENRIVGITESYENGSKTIEIVFGEDYNMKKIKEMI